MITIKPLSQCTFDEAVKVWNEGFQGYFFDMTSTMNTYLHRLAKEEVSPQLSVVAWADGLPVGFVMNGIRNIQGKKVAWNGGTGVIPAFRRKGVAQELMDATMEIYRKEGVQVATLEAISHNQAAISLYKRLGYTITDHLVFLRHKGSYPLSSGMREEGYHLSRGPAHELSRLPMYRSLAPWQNQWASLPDGEAIIAHDPMGKALGYALIKRAFDEEGNLSSIGLYQCEVAADREDADAISRFLLTESFAPLDQTLLRSTVNLPVSNQRVYTMLKEAGFDLFIEQVHMMKIF